MSTYAFRCYPLVINDSPDRLDFHIKSGDYLAYLATKLGFIEEALEKCDAPTLFPQEREVARELRQDLSYVHSRYRIVPRDKAERTYPSGNVLPE